MSKRIIALYSKVIGNSLWVPFIIKNSHIGKMNLSLHLFVSMYACMCTCLGVYVEVRVQPVGVGSLLPPHRAHMVRPLMVSSALTC